MKRGTIRLLAGTAQRLAQIAASRGISLNTLMEKLGTSALAVHDGQARFRLMGNAGEREAAVDILARLDERDGQTTSLGDWRL